MANTYELNYQKIHNTLEKDAGPNVYGDVVGKRVTNLMPTHIHSGRSLKSDKTYGTVRDDSKANTEDLKTILFNFEYDDYTNLHMVNSDFYQQNYDTQIKNNSYVKVNSSIYPNHWYRCCEEGLFFPWTLTWAYTPGFPSYNRDIRSLSFHSDKVYCTGKIKINPYEDYTFQIVSRYGKWPTGAQIYYQYIIESPARGLKNKKDFYYVQPISKPCDLTADNFQINTSYILKYDREETITNKGFFVPTNPVISSLQNITSIEGNPSLRNFYIIFYITNVRTEDDGTLYIGDKGNENNPTYSLDNFSFFFFHSSTGYSLDDKGTILEYRSPGSQQTVNYYDYNILQSKGSSAILERLQELPPKVIYDDDTGQECLKIGIDNIYNSEALRFSTANEFCERLGINENLYWKISETNNDLEPYDSIQDEYNTHKTESFFTTKGGTAGTSYSSYENFLTALKNNNGILYLSNGTYIGYDVNNDKEKDFYYIEYTSVQIMNYLLQQNLELVLVPSRDYIVNCYKRKNSWRLSDGIEREYSVNRRRSNIRLIDMTNKPVQYANDEWGTYTLKDGVSTTYTSGLPRVSTTNTVIYKPYVNIGVFRLKLFYDTPSDLYKEAGSYESWDDFSKAAKEYGGLYEKEEVTKGAYYIGAYYIEASYKKDTIYYYYNGDKLENIQSYFYIKLYLDAQIKNDVFCRQQPTSQEYKPNSDQQAWARWNVINFTNNNTDSKSLLSYEINSCGWSRSRKIGITFAESAYNYKWFVKHLFLPNYEYNLIHFFAKMRPDGKDHLNENDVLTPRGQFVPICFQWGILDIDQLIEHMAKYNIDWKDRVLGDRFKQWGRKWLYGSENSGEPAFEGKYSTPIFISKFIGHPPSEFVRERQKNLNLAELTALQLFGGQPAMCSVSTYHDANNDKHSCFVLYTKNDK